MLQMADNLVINYKQEIKNYQKGIKQDSDDNLVVESINQEFDKLYIDLSSIKDCDYWLKLRYGIFYSDAA
jgi:hypothetical protein